MRVLASLLTMVMLVSCGENDGWGAGLDVPPELADLRENAFHCYQDVEFTHAERSEHCVLVAEQIFDTYREVCEGSRAYECMNWESVRSDVHGIYQRAILESLFNHGKSEEMDVASEGRLAGMIYFRGETMRSLFEDCLRSEEEALAETGFRRVHQVTIRPLQDGQRCFRAGYPDLKSKRFSPRSVIPVQAGISGGKVRFSVALDPSLRWGDERSS